MRLDPLPFDAGSRYHAGMPIPAPFTLTILDADVAALKDRLARTRWPDQAPGEPWAVGTDTAYMRDLVAYWRDRFDWRTQEAALNAFPNFTLELDGGRQHFLQVPGDGPDPTPLLLMHGWPGSLFEFIDIIPRLTAAGFTVVAPSLPGYGLSFEPGQKRFGVSDIADTMHRLMTDALGYQRFAVQGGDWGAHIGSNLAARYPASVIGLHLNMLSVPNDAPAPANPTAEEKAYLEQIAHWSKEEAGYTAIQGTRPQTLAFAMTDSPAGLAAWIVEKFRAWSDNEGTIESAIARDRMLANVSLYWFTGAIGSSFWPYYARLHGDDPIPKGTTVGVPVGHAAFPCEIRRPPRSLASTYYTDIRRWTPMAKGGHFAALEQPAALAEDITAFFRGLTA